MRYPFAITGATGNVGSKIVDILLAAGEPVRTIARDRSRLGPFAARGAEPWPGDLEDVSFLEEAFAGARAVFMMIPPKYDAPDMRGYQRRVGDALAAAARRAGVARIVTLSSIGAHLPEGTGPILGLHDLEKALDAIPGVAVVHLRPAYFMENHLWSIPLIRGQGVNGSLVRGDAAIPMIATRDIAAAAARRLRDERVAGRSAEHLLGPRDLTMAEATRILGKAVGKPDLPYVQFPEEEVRKAMRGMGMSDSAVEAMVEMQRAFNAGSIRAPEGRTAESTTPTTLEEFAQGVFAPAFRTAA